MYKKIISDSGINTFKTFIIKYKKTNTCIFILHKLDKINNMLLHKNVKCYIKKSQKKKKNSIYKFMI